MFLTTPGGANGDVIRATKEVGEIDAEVRSKLQQYQKAKNTPEYQTLLEFDNYLGKANKALQQSSISKGGVKNQARKTPPVSDDVSAVKSDDAKSDDAVQSDDVVVRQRRVPNEDAIEFMQTRQMLDHLLDTSGKVTRQVAEEQRIREIALNNDVEYAKTVDEMFQLLRGVKDGVKELVTKLSNFNIDLALLIKEARHQAFWSSGRCFQRRKA